MTRAVDLEITRALLEGAAREMGSKLQRASYSPNIKERRDHSCAIFDEHGALVAQAEHIPVHLGAMEESVAAAAARFRGTMRPGDAWILNDPYRGGTHLPDLTLVAPVHADGSLVGFVANRAHHADVGGRVPGSMPASAREIFEEGIVLPPVRILEEGVVVEDVLEILLANVRTPEERRGDLSAQIAANALGARRLSDLAARRGVDELRGLLRDLLDAGERLADAALRALPAGSADATDFLEGDGVVDEDLAIRVRVELGGGRFLADFEGTARESASNVNAPKAVARSAVLYAARVLLGPAVLANAGLARRIDLRVPERTILHPRPPAAVAAGNVETSQRTVDALLRALARLVPDRVPAASQGTMNNVTIGGTGREGAFTYYETLAGGEGAHPLRDGMSGVHTHMTNTRNTPIEALEHAYPLRVRAYRLRGGTGGAGARRGGDGLLRAIEILAEEAEASLLTDRRRRGPWGLGGGGDGHPGSNRLVREGSSIDLPSKGTLRLHRGDVLEIATPGGGGFGAK